MSVEFDIDHSVLRPARLQETVRRGCRGSRGRIVLPGSELQEVRTEVPGISAGKRWSTGEVRLKKVGCLKDFLVLLNRPTAPRPCRTDKIESANPFIQHVIWHQSLGSITRLVIANHFFQ